LKFPVRGIQKTDSSLAACEQERDACCARGIELQRRNHVRDRVVERYLSLQVGFPVAR
jgi:hypothetical protein